MTITTTTTSTIEHPDWCDTNLCIRQDATTDRKTHPEDFVTLHRGAPVRIATSRDTVMKVYLEHYEYDHPSDDSYDRHPWVTVDGNDGSAYVCHLDLLVTDIPEFVQALQLLAGAAEANS